MSKTIVEYQMALSEDTDDFAEYKHVNDLLGDGCGWQPYGSPVVQTINERDYTMQAMALYELDDEQT